MEISSWDKNKVNAGLIVVFFAAFAVAIMAALFKFSYTTSAPAVSIIFLIIAVAAASAFFLCAGEKQ